MSDKHLKLINGGGQRLDFGHLNRQNILGAYFRRPPARGPVTART